MDGIDPAIQGSSPRGHRPKPTTDGRVPGIQATFPRDHRPGPVLEGIDPATHGLCPRGHPPEPTLDAPDEPMAVGLNVTMSTGTRGAWQGWVVELAI